VKDSLFRSGLPYLNRWRETEVKSSITMRTYNLLCFGAFDTLLLQGLYTYFTFVSAAVAGYCLVLLWPGLSCRGVKLTINLHGPYMDLHKPYKKLFSPWMCVSMQNFMVSSWLVRVFHPPQKFKRPPFWNGWSYGIRRYGIEVTFNGRTSLLKFLRRLVKKLLLRGN
jgi:hypothetical protein